MATQLGSRICSLQKCDKLRKPKKARSAPNGTLDFFHQCSIWNTAHGQNAAHPSKWNTGRCFRATSAPNGTLAKKLLCSIWRGCCFLAPIPFRTLLHPICVCVGTCRLCVAKTVYTSRPELAASPDTEPEPELRPAASLWDLKLKELQMQQGPDITQVRVTFWRGRPLP